MGWLFQDTPIPDPVEHLRQKFIHQTQTHATEVLDAAGIGAAVRMAVCMATRITEGAEP
jgi:hypothetical protein